MSTTITKFFEWQKLDLSDKPNEDNERKKASESSSNVLQNKGDTHIFEEQMESPRCAGIPCNCL